MTHTVFYWFRNDLRLLDNPAFLQACSVADYLVPVVIHDPGCAGLTRWGFERIGAHRSQFLQASIGDLRHQLRQFGSELYEFYGSPEDVFLDLKHQLGCATIYCKHIEAPEEKQTVEGLQSSGLQIKSIWQSSMLDPTELPFALKALPDVFTAFRKSVEAAKLTYALPKQRPASVPALPAAMMNLQQPTAHVRSLPATVFEGGESKALSHIHEYLDHRLPDTYKQTRNQLMGKDFSSKLSPWLAHGCCSARWFAHQLKAYESRYGANDGTYWLWFELLWRDYFEFLPFRYGDRLFHGQGLSAKPIVAFDAQRFQAWSSGHTPEMLVNAGMKELAQTGYLSNRMRQIVASYWIYDMGGDWRAGAAWFEANLIDYDVYSNQGNWLYIAGRGTDPRGGRPFNVAKQTLEHDPDGSYRKKWLT
jgi:deoxyribodipyrimidine photo-lyase